MEVRLTRYDSETAELICAAGKVARRMGHSYVGSAHLLLAMVQNRGFAGSVLRGFGLNITVTEDMTAVLYGKGTPELPLPQGLTAELRGILRGAAKEAKLHKSREIGSKHMLLALVRRKETAAGALLNYSGVDCCKSVCNGKCSSAFGKAFKRFLNNKLAFVIKSTCGFVQNKYRRIL